MAEKEVSGISGVLGELVSSEPNSEDLTAKKVPSALGRKSNSVATSEMAAACKSSCARLGRPPGNTSQPAGPKEKVTLRIPSDLIAAYRDWSWEARCQLSELVEKALLAYQKSNRK